VLKRPGRIGEEKGQEQTGGYSERKKDESRLAEMAKEGNDKIRLAARVKDDRTEQTDRNSERKSR
jgi:hypothetical protein